MTKECGTIVRSYHCLWMIVYNHNRYNVKILHVFNLVQINYWLKNLILFLIRFFFLSIHIIIWRVLDVAYYHKIFLRIIQYLNLPLIYIYRWFPSTRPWWKRNNSKCNRRTNFSKISCYSSCDSHPWRG